ncbi:unnamed protein product [Paramecium sonneborni]|uniref:Uncharacterized protein n=1 Tax=Paramecium sonneborni TaxID=65129 RepID=A0A8S1L061_9CILI|nr:unnamed protein product [Paramecium sonneborni]
MESEIQLHYLQSLRDLILVINFTQREREHYCLHTITTCFCRQEEKCSKLTQINLIHLNFQTLIFRGQLYQKRKTFQRSN